MSALVVLAVCSMALGTPCWSAAPGNQCGDVPACGQFEPSDASTMGALCDHTYCDDGQLCPNDSSKKRVMITERWMFGWVTLDGVEHYCVGPQYTTPTSVCCLCAQPGTFYQSTAE